MRILHISKYYYPYVGGVENTCKYLVENMPENQFAVVCFNEEREDRIDTVNGVKVYRVGAKVTISRQALSLSYFFILKKAIKDFRPQIIHFHWANPYPALVLLTVIPKDVKLIIHWHMDIIKQKKIYPLIKPVETALLKRADRICVTSPQYRDGSKPLQLFKDKVRIVQSAIDEKKLQLVDGDKVKIKNLKAKFGGKKIIFFIGRHIQYKGLPCLLEAEKYVKSDCEFLIAGRGPLTEELKSTFTSPRIHFLGKISDNDARICNYAADVFAFPSITKNEAFGLSLCEAMYCYTPAVTFTIPGSGVNWVNLNGETGIEVPNGDVKAFASAIDKLLCDQVLNRTYAEAAHKRIVDYFTLPSEINALRKVYKELNIN